MSIYGQYINTKDVTCLSHTVFFCNYHFLLFSREEQLDLVPVTFPTAIGDFTVVFEYQKGVMARHFLVQLLKI